MVLWFVPEYLGIGDFLRAAARARKPNPDSAAFAAHPFIEVFNRSLGALDRPSTSAGCSPSPSRCTRSSRPQDGLKLAMAAIATVLMVAVAGMTQAGFAGNLRYVALPAALVCVLAGAGWVWLVESTNAASARSPPTVLAARHRRAPRLPP